MERKNYWLVKRNYKHRDFFCVIQKGFYQRLFINQSRVELSCLLECGIQKALLSPGSLCLSNLPEMKFTCHHRYIWLLPRFWFCFVFCLFCFLGVHLQHMEVPRLRAELELQLLAYATATATRDPSCVCNLHHSSRQRWILNLLIEARDETCVLTDASQVC